MRDDILIGHSIFRRESVDRYVRLAYRLTKQILTSKESVLPYPLNSRSMHIRRIGLRILRLVLLEGRHDFEQRC